MIFPGRTLSGQCARYKSFPIVIAACGHYVKDYNINLEEAKDILLKLESLVLKTNRQFKKGERLDSISFLKLHRKRIGMLEMQEEAEGIVREGDLEFYRAWTDRVLDKPTHYNFIQFRLMKHQDLIGMEMACS